MGDGFRQARWALFGLLVLMTLMAPASAQTKNSAAQESAAQSNAAQELLRQQERERILREAGNSDRCAVAAGAGSAAGPASTGRNAMLPD
jgi:hypothetical protein